MRALRLHRAAPVEEAPLRLEEVPVPAPAPGELLVRVRDAAILFAPAGELVPPILCALRGGGTLACAGIHMSPIPSIDYDAELFGERVLRSVTANTGAAVLRVG